MNRYRRVPKTIEATQFVSEESEAVAAWCGGHLSFIGDKTIMVVPTEEGPLKAQLGDWIVRGIRGEHYPVKPDIFDAIYEPAGEDE